MNSEPPNCRFSSVNVDNTERQKGTGDADSADVKNSELGSGVKILVENVLKSGVKNLLTTAGNKSVCDCFRAVAAGRLI